jgi:hypothetical protein
MAHRPEGIVAFDIGFGLIGEHQGLGGIEPISCLEAEVSIRIRQSRRSSTRAQLAMNLLVVHRLVVAEGRKVFGSTPLPDPLDSGRPKGIEISRSHEIVGRFQCGAISRPCSV